jgi:hypothetical protein
VNGRFPLPIFSLEGVLGAFRPPASRRRRRPGRQSSVASSGSQANRENGNLMDRSRIGKRKISAAALGSAIILLILVVAAIAEGDPTKAHTRALLKLRAGREVTILITGGSVNPFVDPADDDNKIPYAWFVTYLQRAYREANISVIRSIWGEATAEELADLTEPILRTVKPDITVLCLGASDYKAATPPETYDRACANLTRSVKALGGFVIVAGAVLPQVEVAAPIHIHTRRNALDAGCTYVDLDATLRRSPIPIGALLRDERRLTAKGTVLLADGLIRAWCCPFAGNDCALPPFEVRIHQGESSLGGFVRVDTVLRPPADEAFTGDATIFFGGAVEHRRLVAVADQTLLTRWILRLPVCLRNGRSMVAPLVAQVSDAAGAMICHTRYVVIAPAVFVDIRSPPPMVSAPERFRLGPANLVFGKYGGASDIDAEIEVTGDAAALHIAALVDDQVVARERPGSGEPGDRVEVLLDLRPQPPLEVDAAPGQEAEAQPYGRRQGDVLPGPGVYRIVLTPPPVAAPAGLRVESLAPPAGERDPRDTAPEARKNQEIQKGITALSAADALVSFTPTGYKAELRIPWAALNAAGRHMQSLGFDVIVHDVDGPMMPLSRLALFGTDPPDPSLFGLITQDTRYRDGMVRVIAP